MPRLVLSAPLALFLATLALPAFGESPSPDRTLEEWEEEAGDETDGDRGRYSEPLVRSGPRSEAAARAGAITFWSGFAAGAVFGGAAALTYTQMSETGPTRGVLREGLTGFFAILGGVGGVTMLTGAILWAAGSSHAESDRSAQRSSVPLTGNVELRADGLAVTF